jgi:H+-translocating NAD(P) transhydrogenase
VLTCFPTSAVLDLFRRPNDPKDHFELYAIPSGLVLAGLGAAAFAGLGNLGTMSGTVAIASAICCIVSSILV